MTADSGESVALGQAVNDALREHAHSGFATVEKSGGYLFNTHCRCGWRSANRYAFGEANDEWRQHQTDAVVQAMLDLGWKPPCPECGGEGWVTVSEHACDGDERRCATECPIPAQERCHVCGPKPSEPTLGADDEPF